MAFVLKDRVKETCTSPGTGTVTLLGASVGYVSFLSVGNGNSTYYCIADQGGANWEVGIGTYGSAGPTLTRDTVLSNSAGTTAKIDFSTGTQDVFVTYPSSRSYGGVGAQGVSTNNTQITESGVFPSTYNGLSVGPITIESGVAITVPSGRKWIVI